MRNKEKYLHRSVNLEKQADHLRSEMAQRNLSNGKMCEILDIKEPSTISHWKSPTKPRSIQDERARKLAELWGVRYEWIKGYDDYRTQQEMDDAAHEKIRRDNLDVINTIGDHKKMLERIGLVMRPVIEYFEIESVSPERDKFGDGHLHFVLSGAKRGVTLLCNISDLDGNIIADRVSVLGIKEQLDLIDDIAKKILMVKYSNSEKDG